MLNIVYRPDGLYNYHLEDGIEVSAGMVATYCGNREVTICRPSNLPVGFFISEKDPFFNVHSDPVEWTTVGIGQGEYETDIYEDGTYKVDDILYCGGTGKISNSKIYRGNPIIGIVCSVKDDMVGFISVFANLEAVRFGGKDEVHTRKTKVVPT